MDGWGDDPWADNATTTSPRKDLGASASKSNTFLAGFGDDAGWGDFEETEDAGWDNAGWNEEATQDANGGTDRAAFATVDDVFAYTGRTHGEEVLPALSSDTDALESAQYHEKSPTTTKAGEEEQALRQQQSRGEEEAAAAAVSIEDQASPVLEGTDVHNDNASSHDATIVPVSLRPMSSSSEATYQSETGTTSSARTSLEHSSVKTAEEENVLVEHITTPENVDLSSEASLVEGQNVQPRQDAERMTERIAPRAEHAGGPTFDVDQSLLAQILTTPENTSAGEELAPDLIDSTSTRRSWYRLSRQQTLRCFLRGDSDDTYVRVAWSSSRIHSETIKIVSRWTSEDRINGRTGLGGSTRASFGWDEAPQAPSWHRKAPSHLDAPATTHRLASHSRKVSSVNHANAPASPVASFGWSTSPVTANIEDLSSRPPGVQVPIPTSADNPWLKSVASRPSSLHVTATSLDAAFADFHDAIQPGAVTTLESPGSNHKAAGLTINTGKAIATDVDGADDEDEWGEMVQSPPPPASPKKASATSQTPDPCQESFDRTDAPKSRKVSPISFTPVKYPVPDGPLSPARKAAFNAARVTRTLSAQHPESLCLEPEPEKDMATHSPGVSAVVSVPSSTPATSSSRLSSPVEESLKRENSDFEILRPKAAPPSAGSAINSAQDMRLESEDISRSVQNILAKVPDLSYMFR